MKILITGVHGFVGTNLVDYLSDSNEIYGLDIVSPSKKGVIKTFSWHDLENEMLPNVDAVIHLAGKAHDTKKKSSSEIYFQINTDLTKKIFDYVQKKHIRKFIFFSSVKAAADRVVGDKLYEDVVPAPVGPYGESKILAEKYIQSKWDVNSSEEFVYILRPCMIHGPGNKGNLNLLYNVVSKGIPWPLGAFDNLRSFTSIDNLSYIIENLLQKSIKSGIYHVGDDDPISTNELIKIIGSVMGKKNPILHINKTIMNFIAQIGSLLHLPLNKERLNKLTENYVVSNEKIKKELNIKKMPIKAVDGLKRTIESFQNKKV